MLIRGDAQFLPLKSNTVDAIVTDPPYGLEFMEKEWDHGVPSIEFWIEGLRVCKPGAYLLAFGGTRTFHRLTCAIEDAGWEFYDDVPRDQASQLETRSLAYHDLGSNRAVSR